MSFRKYNHNDKIFLEENEKSFYLAGFTAADGCVMNDSKRYILKIKLASKDESHLLKIKNLFEATNPIYYNYNKKENTSNVMLVLSSKDMINDLKKFNIVPRKTKIYTFPEWLIDHPLVHHFMRGYFDGDGSVYIKKIINQPDQLGIEIGGNSLFISLYGNIIDRQCNFMHHSINIRDNDNARVCYGGTNNILKIKSFLYKDATIFLDRKKDLFSKSLEYSKRTRTRSDDGRFSKSVII